MFFTFCLESAISLACSAPQYPGIRKSDQIKLKRVTAEARYLSILCSKLIEYEATVLLQIKTRVRARVSSVLARSLAVLGGLVFLDMRKVPHRVSSATWTIHVSLVVPRRWVRRKARQPTRTGLVAALCFLFEVIILSDVRCTCCTNILDIGGFSIYQRYISILETWKH